MRIAALALVAALAAAAAFAEAPAPGAAAQAKAEKLALPEARERVAAAGTALAAKLEELSALLAPSDALDLITECLPKLGQGADGARWAIMAGDLALLLGRFPVAADLYEEAYARGEGDQAKGGVRDPDLLLKAARARLASGEADKATDLASLVLMAASGPEQSARARLVGAWALAIRGLGPEAKAMAEAIAGQDSKELPAEIRREARFLCWAVAGPEARGQAASRLSEEFPGSAEAQLSSGTMFPAPLPHWYLGDLSLAGPARPAAAPPKIRPPAAPFPEATAQPAAPGPLHEDPQAVQPVVQARRFQVGYYSMEENARSMRESLVAKGFAATIEARPQVRAKAGDDGKRWAVVVEGGGDPARTQARLKDAGYESYPLF